MFASFINLFLKEHVFTFVCIPSKSDLVQRLPNVNMTPFQAIWFAKVPILVTTIAILEHLVLLMLNSICSLYRIYTQ